MHVRYLFLRKHIMIIHGGHSMAWCGKEFSWKKNCHTLWSGGTPEGKQNRSHLMGIPLLRPLSVRIHIYGGCSQAKPYSSLLPENPRKYGISFKQAVYLCSGQVSDGSQHVHWFRRQGIRQVFGFKDPAFRQCGRYPVKNECENHAAGKPFFLTVPKLLQFHDRVIESCFVIPAAPLTGKYLLKKIPYF